jgi:hypothetical protein
LVAVARSSARDLTFPAAVVGTTVVEVADGGNPDELAAEPQASTASATNMAGTTAVHGTAALMRDIVAPSSGAVLGMRTVGETHCP